MPGRPSGVASWLPTRCPFAKGRRRRRDGFTGRPYSVNIGSNLLYLVERQGLEPCDQRGASALNVNRRPARPKGPGQPANSSSRDSDRTVAPRGRLSRQEIRPD